MILDFKFTNYRSYKNKAVFSMQAESAKSETNNLIEFENTAGQQFKILKAAIVYGPNASGKSNLIKAILDVIDFIVNRPIVDTPIRLYKPFKFEKQTKSHPSSIEITFLGPKKIKYNLKFQIQENQVISESLDYYPNNRKSNIYFRDEDTNEKNLQENDNTTVIIKYRKKEFTIFKNQLFLSRFAEDPDDILTPVYQYFRNNYGSSLRKDNAAIQAEISKNY
ncbi:ATP-binding protein [Arachidicoccus ginsenosidivorans]|uniref:ATP-binding protein n=1 Tax=Arachidicoccus ginsenosidivorans TaxID=496057 RepID=A0A5B8VS38_9BACT|nr:AAA family ATPase [Arachidicoccus ginsenosidivorans]QEC74093.1 ATP-binding protein [Arachidicoccus ginsenosidivorans]